MSTMRKKFLRPQNLLGTNIFCSLLQKGGFEYLMATSERIPFLKELNYFESFSISTPSSLGSSLDSKIISSFLQIQKNEFPYLALTSISDNNF